MVRLGKVTGSVAENNIHEIDSIPDQNPLNNNAFEVIANSIANTNKCMAKSAHAQKSNDKNLKYFDRINSSF